jgi:2,3-bisphosphoglycerate-independent phosphoglycerate mutase
MTQKVALIILDGWGYGDGGPGDAVSLAKTPVMDHLLSTYPHTHLYTYGDHVGLPDGQMGNSEV